MTKAEEKGRYFKGLLLFAGILISLTTCAQVKPVVIGQARQIMGLMEALRKDFPIEKLYLHLDKHNYLAGDTLWFKAYLLEGPYLMPSAQSGMFYAELVNDGNVVLKRMKFPVKYGLSWGNISLDDKDFPTGNYLLRAYTNWMLNFGEAAVYTTNIYINNPAVPVVEGISAKRPVPELWPDVQNTEATLTIKNDEEKSVIELSIWAGESVKNNEVYYLVGQSRGVVCYAVPIDLTKGKLTNVIEKDIFPTGIARFTLMNKNLQPLSERLIYIDHRDQLNINIRPLNAAYKSRDSITLQIQVTDKNNTPIQGSFSLAVTDDTQVSAGNLKNGDFTTYMLLASELKAKVNNGDDYSKGTASVRQALDSLIRQQGWIGYNWKDVSNIKKTEYVAEPAFVITGKVTSVFKGVAGAKVNLFSKKPFMLKDTLANQDGRFIFKDLPISDTTVYKLQATNKNGKGTFINLEVDEWKPPVFKAFYQQDRAADVNSDSSLVKTVRNSVVLKEKKDKLLGNTLKEVNIEAKKIVRNSHNLNDGGGADQVFTERDIQKEGKKSLLDLMMQKIKGLRIGGYLFPPSKVRKFGFMINGQLVKIIIDGVDVDAGYHYYQIMDPNDGATEGMQERYLFLRDNLDDFTAEDILGVEVMQNASFNIKYNTKFLSQAESTFSRGGGLSGVGGVSGIDYAYIEITTRNGKGPFIKKTPGAYLYKPLAFSLPRKFYRPTYTAKEMNKTIFDIRSTVHWEPNIVTDEKGQATISFYAADQPGSYTIRVEGSDMNGKMGSMIKAAFIKIMP